MSTNKNESGVEVRISTRQSTLLQTALKALCLVSLALAGCDKAPVQMPLSGPVQSNVGAPQAGGPAVEETPLAKAARRGNLAKAKELLDEGANVNASDVLGRTPLHMAAFSGYPKTSGLLMERGANLAAKDRVGMTPLHAAVLGGELQEVELLLEKKSDIQASTDTGLQALHLAAATGQDQLVTALVRRGADPRSTDRDGHTPRFYAEKNQHASTVALLQKY